MKNLEALMKPRVVLWIVLLGVLGIAVTLLLVVGSLQGSLQARIPLSPTEEVPEAVLDADAGECSRTCEASCAGFPQETDTQQCLQECQRWCGEALGAGG